MKPIAVIGSTGSIGEKVLEIVRLHPDRFKVTALAARQNTAALLKQAQEFRPDLVCLFDKTRAKEIEGPLKKLRIRLVTGEEGLMEASVEPGARQVIFALVGAIGLKPLLRAIQSGKISR